MDSAELIKELKTYSLVTGIPLESLRAIPKNELRDGQEYSGTCRNSSKATWKGDHFEYLRTKWGSTYVDKINHYEDDNGFDLFIPIMKKDKISELEEKRKSLWESLEKVDEELRVLRSMKRNLEGKYIYRDHHGYMYVKTQTVCDKVVYLGGVTLEYSYGPYQDDSWLSYDAQDTWELTPEFFMSDCIKEVTEEEFMGVLKGASEGFLKAALGWLKEEKEEA